MLKRTAPEAKMQTEAAPAQRAGALLAWYDRHARKLPWRAPPGVQPDPYAVWLSEIMLQQTTVPAVKSYFEKFLALWPDVEALAAADREAIMRAWAGLGYYSRARNLHACAQTVIERHGGVFPAQEAELRKLPGIGPYTAAAIAAIAFGRRAVVVDANVERVVARLFAIADPLPAAKPAIRAGADAITPHERAGDFAQAMMDLGATICTPKKPACALCPFADDCAARRRGDAESFPRKAPKADKPHREGAIFVARRKDGHLLVRTRPPKGLLGGMTEFPGSDWLAGFEQESAHDHAPVKAKWRRLPGDVQHVFTHFSLRLTVYAADIAIRAKAPDGCRFVGPGEIDGEALPTLMRKVLELARRNGI